MKLSISVRIAEGFLSKEIPILSLRQVAEIASSTGYESVCMRASQLGVHSTREDVAVAKDTLAEFDLGVSMVTGDFDTVYNNDDGPNALRNIGPYVDLAVNLGAPFVRVALKNDSDIVAAREAANIAEDAGVGLLHQCHTLSLFETIDGIEATLKAIGHNSFGLIYEPANLELCGQDYGPDTIARLSPWIKNVYLQNQQLKSDGAVELNTWCQGPSKFDIIPIHRSGGVDFPRVFEGLKSIGYDGPVTVHQSSPAGEEPGTSAKATAEYLRGMFP